jgi:hypothetical protein
MSSEIQLQPDGSIHGAEKVVASGQYAIKYRGIYKSMKPLELRIQVEKDLNSRYPGAKLEKFEFTALDDLGSPFEAQVEFFCQNYAAKIDSDEDFSHLIFAMPSHGLIEYYSLAVSDEGRNVIFEHPFQIKRNLKLSLPQGYHPVALPDPIELRWDFGKLNREYTKAEGQVEYRLEFLISDKQVPDKSYLRLKGMLEKLGREEREQILLWKS